MKVTDYNAGSTDRNILIGMVTDGLLLARIQSIWEEPGLFLSRPNNLIAKWCLHYYKEFERAPNRGIAAIFQQWAETSSSDEATIGEIDSFLTSLENDWERLSQDGERLQTDYLLKLAEDRFSAIKLKQTANDLLNDLEAGMLDRAKQKIQDYHPVEMGVRTGVDLFQDEESAKAVFTLERDEVLIEYEGDLKKFFGLSLSRGQFVALIAGEKTGKTSLLVDMAYRAHDSKHKVAFFEIGDETAVDIDERFFVRSNKHPRRSEDGKWPYIIKVPSSIKPHKNCAMITYKSLKFDRPLSHDDVCKDFTRIKHKIIRGNSSYFRRIVHAAAEVTVDDICRTLDKWAREEFRPDVVVIDYADNILPPRGFKERDGINRVWQQLRSISMNYGCLLLTATQANRDSYGKRTIDRRHVSEDKRKLATPNGLVGATVNNQQKEAGIIQLNWVLRRGAHYNPRVTISLAGSLAIGCPAMLSCYDILEREDDEG